jgi:RNA polymerase sigma factor (sigma-70 family)
MVDDLVLLVRHARAGDRQAWEELVKRFAPLVWSICRRLGLARPDAEDAGQQVWLRLFEHLAELREPAALPGWLVTTTRRECLRVLRVRGQDAELMDMAGAGDHEVAVGQDLTSVEEAVLAAEREAALRDAFRQLRPDCRQLLELLTRDPPMRYREISAKLGIAIGSIGPTRGRCLAALRTSPALAALIDTEDDNADGGEGIARPVVGR